jgi:hypothetical protein
VARPSELDFSIDAGGGHLCGRQLCPEVGLRDLAKKLAAADGQALGRLQGWACESG